MPDAPPGCLLPPVDRRRVLSLVLARLLGSHPPRLGPSLGGPVKLACVMGAGDEIEQMHVGALATAGSASLMRC